MEEIKKIEVQGTQYGVADMLMRGVMGGNAQVIEWSHTHNMNDYKDAGTYRIKGERTGNPLSDNLPIMNQGSGHTIDGVLYVLDSSLTNGSGKESDCTITQFLMLSNRVGGQEGDMYMRSAYGANKDSLTWKPWEKYQTNMEVGVVSDEYTLNPSNPTQAISYGGMEQLTDNGIYSGIYFGPKCMVGTGEDNWHISVQNATAVETFVMVVINNYAAASNSRCITQIKFAVTNGGVFSMEKRSTTPGGNIYASNAFSQWEPIGGGSGGSSLVVEVGTTQTSAGIKIEGKWSHINLGTDIAIGTVWENGRQPIQIGTGMAANILISNNVTLHGGVTIGMDSNSSSVQIGTKGSVFIGGDVCISGNIAIGTDMEISNFNEDSGPAGEALTLKKGIVTAVLGTCVIGINPRDIKNDNYNSGFKIYPAYTGSSDEYKVVFEYEGKTAELTLS